MDKINTVMMALSLVFLMYLIRTDASKYNCVFTELRTYLDSL